MPAARMLCVLCACLLLPLTLRAAQHAEPEDSLWSLEDLDPAGPEMDFTMEVSHGWLPAPTAGVYLLGLSWYFGGVIDEAHNLRSASFRPTTQPYRGGWFYTDVDDRIIRKRNSKDEEDYYPTTENTGFSLRVHASPGLPFVLRAAAGIQWQCAMLFAEDKSREWIDFDGKRRSLRELSWVVLDETILTAGLGVELPLYGAFAKTDEIRSASYYYLYGGLAFNYAAESAGTQYMQIANAKDDVRYDNGTDTLRLVSEQMFPTLERSRFDIELALGWNLQAEFAGFNFELHCALPLTAMLSDADWRRYRWGVAISIYFLDILHGYSD